MAQMLQLRAWLVDSEPEVWRQLVVDPRLDLNQLHTVLQISFGWQNCHMHLFHEKDGTRYGTPGDYDPEIINENKVLLGSLFTKKKKRIAYEYDLGDSWMHAVELEAVVDSETVKYPFESFVEAGKGVFSGKPRAAVCIAGARAGPPEDCGGIYGFADILELLANPKKAKSQEARDILASLDGYDPDLCNLAEINPNLGRVRVKKANTTSL